jgi:hypothetical protein
MLQGRFEWTVGVVVVAVVATIVAWYSVVWSRHVDATASVDRSQATVALPPAGTRSRPPVSPPAPPPPATSSPAVARITLVASRGESWIQVRRGSHAGEVIYDGTIAMGSKLRFRSRQIWVRFGRGSNLDLWVNGRPMVLPQFGTYDSFVTAEGARPDRQFHPDANQATAAQSP